MSTQYLKTDNGNLAYQSVSGDASKPGILFLGGFASAMTGTKATFVLEYAQKTGQCATVFDYCGHGESDGDFKEGTISLWLQNALDVLDQLTTGPQILVGASMGGWLMLRLGVLRPQRVARMVGIAPAPGFTEDMWQFVFDDAQRKELETKRVLNFPSLEGDCEISMDLIEDGRKHMLAAKQRYEAPLYLFHGLADEIVPWAKSVDLLRQIDAPFTNLSLVEGGDHRLSRPEELAMLGKCMAPEPALLDPQKL